ncbi:MAG: polysaccharide deacetylase family protein [Terriglobia bacterium]
MAKAGVVYLMYHELEAAGRPMCSKDPGYVRYVVRETDFRGHLEGLVASGLHGISVSEALDGACGGLERVCITFDDGCETDSLIAAPALKQFGFGATFYIVVGFLGRRGYMSSAQVRALGGSGFEIGCHSMTHAYLPGLNSKRLEEEIVASKDRLEQVSGRQVEHFSCPGGRWSSAVARACRGAGYRSVATSRIGINHTPADAFKLARVAVQRGTAPADVRSFCRGEGFWRSRIRQMLLDGAKTLAGNTTYERLRAAVLARR